jgi:hypothetical protein
MSSDNAQSDIRDQVKEDNADFVNRHSSVMKSIKLLNGKTKPPAMQPMYPIVGEDKKEEPVKEERSQNPRQSLKPYSFPFRPLPFLLLLLSLTQLIPRFGETIDVNHRACLLDFGPIGREIGT